MGTSQVLIVVPLYVRSHKPRSDQCTVDMAGASYVSFRCEGRMSVDLTLMNFARTMLNPNLLT